MTPARLSEIRCPACTASRWILDSDYRYEFVPDCPYDERDYPCRSCEHSGPGWAVLQQSPPEFLLQPHDMYPMTQEEFDRWVDVLRACDPRHPCLALLGTTFYPRSPRMGWLRQTFPILILFDKDPTS